MNAPVEEWATPRPQQFTQDTELAKGHVKNSHFPRGKKENKNKKPLHIENWDPTSIKLAKFSVLGRGQLRMQMRGRWKDPWANALACRLAKQSVCPALWWEWGRVWWQKRWWSPGVTSVHMLFFPGHVHTASGSTPGLRLAVLCPGGTVCTPTSSPSISPSSPAIPTPLSSKQFLLSLLEI